MGAPACVASMAVVTARSKERMVLKVAVDEVPERVWWLIELVYGSHLGSRYPQYTTFE